MMIQYRRWLETEGYEPNVVNARVSNVSRIERAYGDIDEAYDQDQVEAIRASLRYTRADARRGVPNPSKIEIAGDVYNGLASLRAAIDLYRRFRDERVPVGQLPPSRGTENEQVAEARERLSLERDLQKALRKAIHDVEDGLAIIDDGAERAVASGFVDITARDRSGNVVVIELKAGTADRAAIGQLLSYMGDIAEEEDAPVRGISVAHQFDDRARAAARMVPSLVLKRYSIRFAFEEA